ncbi:hypothetical protein [Sphingobacterium sp. JB170]|uniref:hypothetical protein n=1 Tax=Sphingobacterium sp. JB170 TaxID=1434842 RepID=UPI00097EF2AC|nr:hypothetical protein [Sphingobacterium sp. JB170]SJN31820.1 hypothetical protein FM107_07075 [Sphingobacterium sp. JB170]
MNFLAHYYFERYAAESERVLGAILPDLLKNADKRYSFHPQRFEESLFAYPKTMWISEGWYRHVEIDKIFHSSTYFLEHCHVFRKVLEPVVDHLPIRASFLAHIAIELLLDHLLIQDELVNPVRLYDHLEQVNQPTIERYLNTIGEVDIQLFFNFYEEFLHSRYILDYKAIENLSYALFNICKRVWVFEVTDQDRANLTRCLIDYKEKNLPGYMDIFHEIQHKIL